MTRFITSTYHHRAKNLPRVGHSLKKYDINSRHSYYKSENSSQHLGMLFQQHKDKMQPLMYELNNKLMNTALDNIRIIHHNGFLIEMLKKQQLDLDQKNHQLAQSAESSKDLASRELEYQEQLSGLKSSIMQVEMKLKNETFSKELLEKELEKKKFKEKMQDGETKLQLKQIQLSLAKVETEKKTLQSKVFDLQEKEKKMEQELKDLREQKAKRTRMKNFYQNMAENENMNSFYQNLNESMTMEDSKPQEVLF